MFMKQDKTISVVMCTYNGASRHLREQLDSIFAQTLLPGEIVVQDDCSTDDTMQVLREYADRAPEGVAMRIVQNTKLEEQRDAIGSRMMCVCRSEPFSDSGAEIRFDRRTPNCNLIRLFYASMMGHCQMLRRQLLDVIPTEQEQPEIYRRTCYDVMTATAAAALDSIVLIDRLLVKQRRYEEAVSLAVVIIVCAVPTTLCI